MPDEQITEEELAEWERLASLAYPGPWDYIGDVIVGVTAACHCPTVVTSHADIAYALPPHESHDVVEPTTEADRGDDIVTHEQHQANCRFIAAARNALPRLLVEVRRLREELSHLRQKVQHGCTDAGCSECDA